MKSKSAEKVKLKSFDDLFGTDAPGAGTGETVTSVPLSQLHTFKDHPFRVLDDEKMQETVDSVKRYGVLIPGIVRPHPESGYEVVAGHRRWRACQLAGLEEMPVLIRDLNDDEATIIMVDTNIQREDILPSEKAKAYRMKYEAMKHQGSKGDKYTADAIGEAAGDSGRTVQRYIRLSELVQELLDYVDENKIPMVVGEKLSYLKQEEQVWVVDAVGNSGIFPSKAQAEQIRESSEAGELTEGGIYAVLVRKEKENVKVTISAKMIRNYFPESYSKEQIESVIYTLLEDWRQKEGGTADAGNTV
jgi:ParB family chromosome partitioning protein